MKSNKYVVLALGAALAGLLTIAASTDGQGQHKLGGAWLGGHPGFVWNCLQIPSDPAGQTEAFRVSVLQWGADFAGLLSGFGADRLTDFVGEGRMISQDTAKWRCVGYAQAVGNPPTTTAIVVYSGTFKYTGLDTALCVYTVSVYLASADANGDGYPDAGTQPVLTIPDIADTAQRVPWQ